RLRGALLGVDRDSAHAVGCEPGCGKGQSAGRPAAARRVEDGVGRERVAVVEAHMRMAGTALDGYDLRADPEVPAAAAHLVLARLDEVVVGGVENPRPALDERHPDAER